MRIIEPFAGICSMCEKLNLTVIEVNLEARVPYMVVPGNHEYLCYDQRCPRYAPLWTCDVSPSELFQ